jgi:hypothetical protein
MPWLVLDTVAHDETALYEAASPSCVFGWVTPNDGEVSTYGSFVRINISSPHSVLLTLYTWLYPSIATAMALMSVSDNFALLDPTAELMSPTAPVFWGKE